MANTDPVADDARVIAEVRAAAARAGLADVFPVGAITKGLEGEVARRDRRDGRRRRPRVQRRRPVRPHRAHAPQRAHVRAGVRRRRDRRALRGRLARRPDSRCTRGSAPRRSASRGSRPPPRTRSCSGDIEMARLTGGRLHICHLSSARAVELVRRAKADGLRVSAEVTPHHLVFTDEDLRTYDTNRKVNPPLRTAEDRDALREGCGRRHDRRDRHRSRAARGRGEGGRVRPVAARHDRAGDGARGRADRARRARVSSPLPRALETLSSHAGSDPRRAVTTAGRSRPGRPANLVRLRSRRALDRRAAVRLEVEEQRVHGPGAAAGGSAPRCCTASSRSRRGRPRGDGAPAALLALEDGTVFRGIGFGAEGEAFGEAVFNTGMAGYQEVLTDPSYAGQIVTMTAPMQGNYGMHADDAESERIQVAAFAVRRRPGVRRAGDAEATLGEALAAAGVVAIEGIDTRRLTRRIRDAGAMRAGVSTRDLDPVSLVARVRETAGMARRRPRRGRSRRAAPYEAAARSSVPRTALAGGSGGSPPTTSGSSGTSCACWRRPGLDATVFPAETPASEIAAGGFDGVLLSNGPGDPSATAYGVAAASGAARPAPALRDLPRPPAARARRSAGGPTRCRSATGA